MATLRLRGLLRLWLVILLSGKRQESLKRLILLFLSLLLWLVLCSLVIVVLLDDLTLPKQVNKS